MREDSSAKNNAATLKATLVEYENGKIGGHLKDLNQGAPQLR